MKHTISLTTLLILLSSGLVSGQTNKIEIGIEGGPSWRFLRGNEIIDYYNEPAIGFSCGMFLQYNLTKTISLRTNIAYERKGSRIPPQKGFLPGGDSSMVSSMANFEYIVLPILGKATFGNLKIRCFVNAGPYFGFLTSVNIVYTPNTPVKRTDHTSFYRRIDIGFTTGIGLSVPVKSKYAVSFEVRNNLGLYDLNIRPVKGESIKTNSTNFLFGLTYKI